MRSIAAFALLFALALLPGLEDLAAGGSSAKPVLRLVDRAPLTVEGVRFRALERVVITADVSDDRYRRVTRATRAGAFTVRFASAAVDRCSGLLVLAIGGGGSRAELKLPAPACPPQLRPG
jgi:hypothetical protein